MPLRCESAFCNCVNMVSRADWCEHLLGKLLDLAFAFAAQVLGLLDRGRRGCRVFGWRIDPPRDLFSRQGNIVAVSGHDQTGTIANDRLRATTVEGNDRSAGGERLVEHDAPRIVAGRKEQCIDLVEEPG